MSDEVKGWRVEADIGGGEAVWTFVREVSRGKAKRWSEMDHDGETWEFGCTRVPELDGTGPVGVVWGEELERLTGYRTCPRCEWSTTRDPICESCIDHNTIILPEGWEVQIEKAIHTGVGPMMVRNVQVLLWSWTVSKGD